MQRLERRRQKQDDRDGVFLPAAKACEKKLIVVVVVQGPASSLAGMG